MYVIVFMFYLCMFMWCMFVLCMNFVHAYFLHNVHQSGNHIKNHFIVWVFLDTPGFVENWYEKQ